MRTAARLLRPVALLVGSACGGTTAPENPVALDLDDAATGTVADATTVGDASAGAVGDASATASGGLDATIGTTCTGGTWALSETAGTCGSCNGIADLVAIVVSDQTAEEGGAVSDSEGNTWTFDPSTCSATLAGDCDASDTIFFGTGTASCYWTCGSYCPACPASCIVTPYP